MKRLVFLLLFLSGCRSVPLAPTPPVYDVEVVGSPERPPGRPHLPTDTWVVPLLGLTGRTIGQEMVITATLAPESETRLEPYDRFWMELALDTDQNLSTGYGGYDYWVDRWPAENYNVFHHSGRQTGAVQFDPRADGFTFRIPTAAFGNVQLGAVNCRLDIVRLNWDGDGSGDVTFVLHHFTVRRSSAGSLAVTE